VFYPTLMLGMYWVYFPPFFPLFGVFALWRRRRELLGQLATLLIASNLCLFVFYFYQGARLVAPAAILLLVFSACGLLDTLRAIRRVFGTIGLNPTSRRWQRLDQRTAPPDEVLTGPPTR
jgi:hypothetical protein